ncbi:hypothetical protein [Rhizobium sp. 007]|uniref:hypothetical protein n=1 Tax=Rhizobium sp. 007 TaxID=2785056 RepID=UPI00188E6CD9|nr:hypothetical protein [Rhizobium sp. 007]QPB24584.1 hypothetical protein ISN39_34220 [Rhizobium sp. 007]
MLRCVRVRGADRSGWPARSRRTRRAARKPMRRTGASIGARRRAGAGRPSGAAHVRGVCPILVLVNRLQKEHPA